MDASKVDTSAVLEKYAWEALRQSMNQRARNHAGQPYLLSSYLDIKALICPTFTYSEHMCKQLKMLS